MEPSHSRDPLIDAAERLAAEIEAAGLEGGDVTAMRGRAAVIIAEVAARVRRVGAHMPDDRFAVLVLELARAALRDEAPRDAGA
jgi:hypothetical protein